MAEKKTRILLRSDVASKWLEVNPVLLRGELGIEYNPAVESYEQVRIKVGDGVKQWSALPYVADYDAKIAGIELSINELKADIEADLAALKAELQAEIAKKVEKEVQGANGKAYIFNETDGGGAKFVHNDGSEAFVGVNDGGENGLMAQIYADKLVEGRWLGAKIDVTNGGMYYTVGDKSFAQRAIPANEIAVKGDVAEKQDKLPEASEANTFLKNDGEGNLSWVKFEIGSADWGHIGGDIEDQEDLMAKFNAIDDEIADRYTKAETDTKIAEEIGKIKHWSYKVVAVLPEPSAECANIIYLVPKGAGKSGYKEYVCINEGSEEVPAWKFEEIGDTDIDLSNYYNKTEIDAKVEALEGQIETAAEAAQTYIDGKVEDLQENIDTEEARAKAEEAKKVDRELAGDLGKSLLFNEKDGGGAKFEGNNGVNAYVGIHDNIGGEIGTQIYVDKASGVESTIIDVTQNGAYYTKGAVLPGAQRDVEANEIATKGVVDAKIAALEFDILDGGDASDWK